MEFPWDEKLLVFLAFFIPGFIIREIYGLFVGIEQGDTQRLLPTIVGFGALHYGVTAFPLFFLPSGPIRIGYVYVDVLLLPVIWAPLALLVRDYSRWKIVFFSEHGYKLFGPKPRGSITGFDATGLILRFLNPQATIRALLSPEAGPWDKTLTNEARFIRIRLKAGRFVGGYFGPTSAVSTFPSERQIFISDVYRFDENGEFGSPVPRTGILVQGDEIETSEIIAIAKLESQQ